MKKGPSQKFLLHLFSAFTGGASAWGIICGSNHFQNKHAEKKREALYLEMSRTAKSTTITKK